jgi:hypothetical protein
LRILLSDSILQGGTGSLNDVLVGWPADANQQNQPQRPGYAELTVLRCTILGNISVSVLDLAQDSLFVGRLQVTNLGRGCMRFCSIDADDARSTIATTPDRYECQPDLALTAYLKIHPDATDADLWSVARGVTPIFTSIKYVDPGYVQLAQVCPAEICRGASDESEMGAYHDLYNPQRESLLRARLAEYSPAVADVQLLFAN